MSDATFNCPHCGQRLKADDRMAGRVLKCPSCGKPLTVSGTAQNAAAPETRATTEPPEPPETGPAPEAQGPAAQSPGPAKKAEQKTHACASRRQAEKQKEERQAELPPVQSAYQPSGKLPPEALFLMLLGSVLGIPAGVLAGGLTLAVGTLLAALCGAIFMAIADACNVFACCPVVLLFLVAIITYFGMFVAIGVASAVTITGMGKLGKNRNVGMPMFLSAVSSFGAVFPFWFTVSRIATDFGNDDLAEAYSFVFKTEGFGLVCLIVGLIVTVVTAVAFALYQVVSAKFCEQCELYMEHQELPPVTFSGAKQLSALLAASAIQDIPGILGPVSEQEGTVALYFCPQCGVGYVESTATYSATWPSGDSSQNMSESWLVASRALSASEVDILRKVVVQ